VSIDPFSNLPDLESLRCFLAGARQLSFRRAAKMVALSPAAFSDRIARLEEQLAAPLFERTTRKVRLTPAGERLLSQAERTLHEARRCHELVHDDRPLPFRLTLGTRFELGMSWLVPSLTRLEAQAPERRLHLYFGDTTELLHQLDREHIDAFVSSARLASAGLSFARLHEERYVFVGSKRLIATKPLERASQAAQHTLLELHADLPLFRYFLDARPGSEEWAFERVQFLGTIGPVRARVLEGAGVAVLPLYFVERDLERGRLVRLLPRTELPVDWFRLVWRANHPREDQLRALAAELASIPLR
jgi:LysR family transcriptional regulator, glycine cleavage system transcriptional activator